MAVLRLLLEPGASAATVAHRLGISERAARSRLASLYRRLGVNSAAQAAWAVRHLLDV